MAGKVSWWQQQSQQKKYEEEQKKKKELELTGQKQQEQHAAGLSKQQSEQAQKQLLLQQQGAVGLSQQEAAQQAAAATQKAALEAQSKEKEYGFGRETLGSQQTFAKQQSEAEIAANAAAAAKQAEYGTGSTAQKAALDALAKEGEYGFGREVLGKQQAFTAEQAAAEAGRRKEQFGYELSERDKYNTLAEQRRLASIQGLAGISGETGSIPSGLGGPGGQLGFNEQAARDAAFARTKDRVGRTSRAAMDSLRNALASSGQLGGGLETERMAQIIGGASGDLNEFEREQLMQDLNRAAQISDRERAAKLTMRGQDLQRQASLLGLFNAAGTIY